MFEENAKCHFFPNDCRFPIPEEALQEGLEDPDSGTISQIPLIDSELCMNCLHAFLIDALKDLSSSRRGS